jgi:hypothetical protein
MFVEGHAKLPQRTVGGLARFEVRPGKFANRFFDHVSGKALAAGFLI